MRKESRRTVGGVGKTGGAGREGGMMNIMKDVVAVFEVICLGERGTCEAIVDDVVVVCWFCFVKRSSLPPLHSLHKIS